MPNEMNGDRGALLPGRTGTATLIVAEAHTAPKLGSGRAPVFGSPAMVALIEAAAVACVEDQLPAGQETLGIHLDVEHIAATPAGLSVTATAELIEVSGRKLVFKVEARDDTRTDRSRTPYAHRRRHRALPRQSGGKTAGLSNTFVPSHLRRNRPYCGQTPCARPAKFRTMKGNQAISLLCNSGRVRCAQFSRPL